MFIYILLV